MGPAQAIAAKIQISSFRLQRRFVVCIWPGEGQRMNPAALATLRPAFFADRLVLVSRDKVFRGREQELNKPSSRQGQVARNGIPEPFFVTGFTAGYEGSQRGKYDFYRDESRAKRL
ncbi:hypothetical protein [Anatilimnocola floriformis]|uniref:hypothetical protein n=1 Tax=Anatilimnocola floriformis TaxID=2948575 RepID=UPI0020C395E1|nr:hypothetical protein [Anatilimnocola floriformis]